MALTADEAKAIESNLFPAARRLVRQMPNFPWHRNRAGNVTAGFRRSSQALAIDLFETIRQLQSRDAIVTAWLKAFGIPALGPWTIQLERQVPPELLGEPRSTQLDATVTSAGLLVVFECKFTESDGGSCSQTGAIGGLAQCNGNYEDQENPITRTRGRCALTNKGIKYWQFVPKVLAIDPSIDQQPCPFAGGWYQWMRNLVAAAALAGGTRPCAVILYVEGPFPMDHKLRSAEWRLFQTLAADREVALRVASYQQLLRLAVSASSRDEKAHVRELDEWINAKIEGVAKDVGDGGIH